MIDLACLAQRLRANGVTLWLAHPQPNIRTLIETVGLHRLPAVRVDGGHGRFHTIAPHLPSGWVAAVTLADRSRCCSSILSSSSFRSPNWRC